MNGKQNQPKIMIVDDDDATVEVFSEYLELNNVNVVATASNGKEAVEVFEKKKPNMCFIDVMMPIHDGFYALEEIRKINSNIPVIMVTADLSKETEERLIELGADKIIYKPFDITELMDIIQNNLGRGFET